MTGLIAPTVLRLDDQCLSIQCPESVLRTRRGAVLSRLPQRRQSVSLTPFGGGSNERPSVLSDPTGWCCDCISRVQDLVGGPALFCCVYNLAPECLVCQPLEPSEVLMVDWWTVQLRFAVYLVRCVVLVWGTAFLSQPLL